MTEQSTPEMPTPPLPYYLPQPERPPDWQHPQQLYSYITDLFLWVELLQSEYQFRTQIGLPVGKHEDWSTFFRSSLDCIKYWMQILKEEWAKRVNTAVPGG